MGTIYLFITLCMYPFFERLDTVVLQAVDVVASIKSDDESMRKNYSSTTVERIDIENRHIVSLKEITAVAPNFYKPDYGSRMTSSIYVRGFGSRIDQPVVALSVDEMPVMNKNNYDFDFFDISRVQLLRGAQSTLYGRNTSGGAVNIYTLSPLTFQGKRLSLEYGTANSLRIKASHYEAKSRDFGWSVSMHYGRSDGFFLNRERGEECDGGSNVSARIRHQWLPGERWSIDNALTVGYVDEGGWGYRLYDKNLGTLRPIAYNDACTYRRFNIGDGLVVKRFFDDFTLSSTTGYQYMDDRMRIDNDFLPLDYFSMGQYQREHAFTQEFVARSVQGEKFDWIVGTMAFYKHLTLDAPVLFKQYGIENLIMKNANDSYFHLAGPDYHLEFRDPTFSIEDKFTIPTVGAALYGEASLQLGRFLLKAGARLDYERSTMDYNSYAHIYYKYKRGSPDFVHLFSTFKGDDSVDALEILPRFSVAYNHSRGNIYATLSKGYKAGGFNTQLFSDILKQKIIDDILQNVNNDNASATVYRPEETWNYELGAHLSPFVNDCLHIAASLFYIDCRNQQLTVFPQGESTGRMMSNAGRSHSYGAELSVQYKVDNLRLDASYGYACATFDEYLSGENDYSGKHLPLAPRETVSANIAYTLPVPRSFANFLILNIGWNGVGRIYWNEDNSLTQTFYGLWSASLSWEKGHFGASLWAKNILGERYNTFYFRSIGNDFFAQGKPRQIGLSLHLNLW